MNIMALISALPGAAAQGLIWGIMAIGVYITFRTLDIADLTVDGTMCTGGAVCIMMMMNGHNVWVAMLAAFIAGMLASDYDCTDIFVDGILKICGRDMEKVGAMFDKVAAVSGENTHVTFTISAEVADLTENIKKYLK